MTVHTLSDGRPNRIVEMTRTALWIETERSQALRRQAQEVPAWMFNIAWDYLASRGTLSNRTLLEELNVHRSSLVCAVVALIPPVDVVSRRPIQLAFKAPSADVQAAQAVAQYDVSEQPGPAVEPYRVHASSTVVEAWSTTRLPFEPTGWSKEFRQALRDALGHLEVPAGQLLHAAYGSADRSFCDVENVLLYNVGIATFATKVSSGVQIERSFAVPETQHGTGTPYQHHYRYGVIEGDRGFERWVMTQSLAMWSPVAWPRRPLKAADWWYAVRRGDLQVSGALDAGALFGLDVVISGPSVLPTGLHNILKPLLDGAIAALQHHDGSNLDVISERLAEGLSAAPHDVGELLTAPDAAVLGRTQLVRPYRTGVQWNPADDRCVAFRVRREPDGGPLLVRGEAFAVTAV